MITTRPKCSKKLYDFIGDLMQMIPNAFYYPRGTLTVTKMAEYASNKEFTHLVVLSEKNKVCNGMLVSHLPEGPTAFFKVLTLTISIRLCLYLTFLLLVK